ncbi:hypothetical protein Tco_0635936 [Tanacetum coccineum]
MEWKTCRTLNLIGSYSKSRSICGGTQLSIGTLIHKLDVSHRLDQTRSMRRAGGEASDLASGSIRFSGEKASKHVQGTISHGEQMFYHSEDATLESHDMRDYKTKRLLRLWILTRSVLSSLDICTETVREHVPEVLVGYGASGLWSSWSVEGGYSELLGTSDLGCDYQGQDASESREGEAGDNHNVRTIFFRLGVGAGSVCGSRRMDPEHTVQVGQSNASFGSRARTLGVGACLERVCAYSVVRGVRAQ